MVKHPKIWRNLSAVALAGTASIAVLTGCESLGLGEGGAKRSSASPTSTAPTGGAMNMTAASGEGAGEGGGADEKAADLKTDNVAYLAQLGMVKGHLLVGVELYRRHAYQMANVHMKHPQDELIKSLEPAFQARGTAGFGKELTALSNAVAARASAVEVDAAYKSAVAAIDAAEQAGTGTALSNTKEVVAQVEQLVRMAASEYAQGVVDGKVVKPKEYQDALGFTQIANQRLEKLKSTNKADADARIKVQAQLDSLKPAWPAIVPPPTVKTDASLLYGAAARIQIAGLSL